MQSKIDWVEIPAGTCITGLSTQQKQAIREKIDELTSTLNEKTRLAVASIINKREKGDRSLTSDDVAVMKKGTNGVLRADALLRKQAEEQTLQLETFYISR